ncbi:MAG: hypothetical protein JNN17_21525 [Verrucomicrobiaceae bacterium]|nr:hypothetical protein [Verrucomicrobiaceae bacterium]
MKHLLLLLAATSALADHAAWTHLQKLPVTQSGLQRVELDPALLDASATALGDLRLVNPAGEERPYALLKHKFQEPPTHESMNFIQKLEGQWTKLEFRIQSPQMVESVWLNTDARGFIKAAKLEATADGVNWHTLNANALLTDQNGPFNRQINFEPGTWSQFRVSVDDRRSAPLVFTGAGVRGVAPTADNAVPFAVKIISRTENGGSTKILIDLGARNLELGTARLLTSEAMFNRSGYNSLIGIKKILYRQEYEGHFAEDVTLHMHELSPERELTLTIRNDENPPLKIDGVEITRHVLPLVFQADVAGEWQLFAGNPQASAPSYDLAKMSDQLRRASSVLVKAGAVEPNPAFRAEAALPATGEAGEVRLDTRGWQWRRAILPSENEKRVFRLDLDDHALAHSTSGGGDLRVIAAEGVLIPHLLIEGRETTRAAVVLTPFPDEKRPKTSRWRFTLPIEKLTVKALHLRTSSSLFQRSIRVLEPVDGKMRSIGSANWKSTPDSPQPELRIDIGGRLQGAELVVETDNGDNPALQLTSVEIEKPVVSLLFEAHGGARPLHLFYGKANAYAPDYDIRFVRDRFEKATHVPVKLGDAEVLKRVKARASSTSGSPWLWAALVLVVGGLLWVVARLLPKVESAS